MKLEKPIDCLQTSYLCLISVYSYIQQTPLLYSISFFRECDIFSYIYTFVKLHYLCLISVISVCGLYNKHHCLYPSSFSFVLEWR